MGHCRRALHRVQELLQLSRRKELGCWLQHWLSNVEDQNFLPLLLSRQPGNTPLAELQAVDCAAAEHDVPHNMKLHAGHATCWWHRPLTGPSPELQMPGHIRLQPAS